MKNTKKLRIEDFKGLKEYDPTKYILDVKNMGLAIVECLMNNDPEGVMEVIAIYLDTLNKSKLAKKAHLSRATMYSSLKRKNPTIKTLAKLVSSSSH